MITVDRVLNASQLPSLPTVAMRLLDVVRDPSQEFGDICELIRADPAISAKLLRTANSSYVAAESPVQSIDRAVGLLGLNAVTSLALSFSIASQSVASGQLSSHFRDYWRLSLVQATAAETLAPQCTPITSSDLFLIGLLNDIGRLALLKTLLEAYVGVIEQAPLHGNSLAAAEMAILGFDHAEVGAALLRRWNLPETMALAVQTHHDAASAPLAELNRIDRLRILAAHIATDVGEFFLTGNIEAARQKLLALTAEQFKWNTTDLNHYLERVRERFAQTDDLFATDLSDLPHPSDLMASANEHLAEIALRAQVAEVNSGRALEELQRRNQVLQAQATRDSLTGVFNRISFDRAFDKALDEAVKGAETIGVLFLDIDHFKRLNDTYGHQFGDEVLKQVADCITGRVRTRDVVARYGGEEFVILTQRPTNVTITKLADSIRAAIEALEFTIDGEVIKVTASVGAAYAAPTRTTEDVPKDLIAAADQAMYDAKHRGRNQICVTSLLPPGEEKLRVAVMRRRFSMWLAAKKILDMTTLSECLNHTRPIKKSLGQVALITGDLTSDQRLEALDVQRDTGIRFGMIAVARGWLTPERLVTLLAYQAEDPETTIAFLHRKQGMDRKTLEGYHIEYLEQHKLMQPVHH